MKTILTIIGIWLMACGALQGQDRVLDSLKRELRNYKKDDTTKVNMLISIGVLYRDNKQLDKAKENIAYALNTLNKIYQNDESKSYDIMFGNIYYANALICKKENLRDSAYKLSNKALEYWEKANSYKGLGQGNNVLGILYYEEGNNQKSLIHYEKALKCYIKIDNKKGQVSVLSNIARVFDKIGKTEEAIKQHYKIIEIAKKIGYQDAIESSYLSLGNIWIEQNEFNFAIYYFNKLYLVAKHNRDTSSLIQGLGSLGHSYSRQKKYDSASFFLNEERKLCFIFGDNDLSLVNLNNLALLSLEQKNYDNALKYNQEAILIAQKTNNKARINEAKSVFAYIYQQKGQCSKAIPIYKELLEFHQQNNEKDGVKDNLQTLSECYEEVGQFQKAINFYRLYINLRDSLTGIEKNKILKDAETKYQTSQKELENTQLRAEKAEQDKAQQQQQLWFVVVVAVITIIGGGLGFMAYRNRQKAKQAATLAALNAELAQTNTSLQLIGSALEKSNTELAAQKEEVSLQAEQLEIANKELAAAKSVLTSLYENRAHDNKNNFQQLLNKLQKAKPNNTNAELYELTQDINTYIFAILEIDRIIYEQEAITQAMQNEEKYFVKKPTYLIGQLVEFCKKSYNIQPSGGLEIVTEIDQTSKEITLTASEKTALGIVVLETVRNALKYAFQDFACPKPTIRISLGFKKSYKEEHKTRNVYELQIADNGKGLPNIAAYRQDSKGLQLIQDFAEQLGSLPTISSEAGKGTSYVVEIKR